MDIAALVKALLDDAGVRQEEIAETLGVSQSSVSRIKTGQQEPTYRLALRIIALAGTKGLLTNKNGTFKVAPSIEVRGRMGIGDEIDLVSDARPLQQAELPFAVPVGCFAVVVEGDGLTPRARRGDLLIAGPSSDDPASMLESEGVFRLTTGQCYFGVLIDGKDPDHFTILCQHNRRIVNVSIAETGPYFATVAAGRWQYLA